MEKARQNIDIKKIDFFAWERHHFDHIIPIWMEIPEKFKGDFYISTHIDPIDSFLIPKTSSFKIFDNPYEVVSSLGSKNQLLVIPSIYGNFIPLIRRPLALFEHGAGQTYKGQGLYLPFRKNVLLDIVPNKGVAKIFKERYPSSHVVVVGCPKLDYWHTRPKKQRGEVPVIAISFHFDRLTVPETRTAWPHFKSVLPELLSIKRWRVIGHGHPRIIDELIPYYKGLGIEVVKDFNEIMERADLYICDNSSTLYEFASTDRPVVVLNAPWYRRDVEHGLRFWEHSKVGINCDEPGELVDKIELALQDPPEQRELRRKVIEAVYPISDGTAAKFTAKELIKFIHSTTYKELLKKGYYTEHYHPNYPGIRKLLFDKLGGTTHSKRVAIFGAGEHTKNLLARIEGLNFNIVGIIDNNKSKEGKIFCGKKVYTPSYIQELNLGLIIISSQAYEEQIIEQLQGLGCRKSGIYPIYKSNINFQKEIFIELYYPDTIKDLNGLKEI